MTNEKPMSFSERRAAYRAEKGLEPDSVAAPAPKPVNTTPVDPVLIPDVLPQRTSEDQQIEDAVNKIGIIEAYRKWIGKNIDQSTLDRTEGVMVSCPKPDHPDKNPSAWINTDKKTWYCAACSIGGDIYDLAAYGKGYDVPGYKDGSTFHRLREDMAEDFGTHIKKVAGGVSIVWTDADTAEEKQIEESAIVQMADAVIQAEPQPAPVTPVAQPEPKTNVTQLPVVPVDYEPDEDDAALVYPTFDWRKIVPEGTFLDEYMKACSVDDSPEEYHFWHGLLALAHAVGRNVTLSDSKPVTANLLVCLLGGTGYGKSRSRSHLDTVLSKSLPFKDNGLDTSGVKVVAVPASGEFLVRQFMHQSVDPNNPKGTGQYTPINGIVDFDEFASLLARANRQGATLKTTIMSFADCAREVKIGSLTHGEFVAHAPFCSITATTQPKAIRTILSRGDQSSGFLNRWVFAGGGKKKREIFGGSHTNTSVDLTRSIDELKRVKAWGAVERSLHVETSALQECVTYFRAEIFPLQEKDDTDLLKRLDLTFKKLLLLFTINLKQTAVSLESFEAARTLVEYLVACYGMVNQEIGVTISHEVTTDIQSSIQKHWQKFQRGASPRDISRYLHRKNYTAEQIKRSLDNMVALDWIELDRPSTTVGRPTTRYKMVGE